MSYRKLYDAYKNVPLETWKKMKSEEVAKFVHDVYPNSKGQKEEGTMFVLAAKIAHATTPDEFEEFMTTGETPAIKLNNEEMKALRGGHRLVIAGFNGMGQADKDKILGALAGEMNDGHGKYHINKKSGNLVYRDNRGDIRALDAKIDGAIGKDVTDAFRPKGKKMRGTT